MIKAYVIGAFRAETPYQISINIEKARDVALLLWKKGYSVFCPHMNTNNFQGEMPDEVWLEGDIEWLKCTDIAVQTRKNLGESKGSKKEIEYCENNKIVLFKNIDIVPDAKDLGEFLLRNPNIMVYE